jgi:hypothetical protein
VILVDVEVVLLRRAVQQVPRWQRGAALQRHEPPHGVAVDKALAVAAAGRRVGQAGRETHRARCVQPSAEAEAEPRGVVKGDLPVGAGRGRPEVDRLAMGLATLSCGELLLIDAVSAKSGRTGFGGMHIGRSWSGEWNRGWAAREDRQMREGRQMNGQPANKQGTRTDISHVQPGATRHAGMMGTAFIFLSSHLEFAGRQTDDMHDGHGIPTARRVDNMQAKRERSNDRQTGRHAERQTDSPQDGRYSTVRSAAAQTSRRVGAM